MTQTLHLVGEPEADRILTEHPFALLTGMLLDQQVPMEVAFDGPRKIVERLGSIDPERIAAALGLTPLEASALEREILARFGASNRSQAVARALIAGLISE